MLYLRRLIAGALGGEYPLVLSDSGSGVRDNTVIQIHSEDGGENQQNLKQLVLRTLPAPCGGHQGTPHTIMSEHYSDCTFPRKVPCFLLLK